MELNPSQKAAVEHEAGPMLALAGPGSGKTAVIAQRTKRLVEKGISPPSILVVTFTKASSIEMKERFQRLCREAGLGAFDGSAPPVQFGTFHAVFFSILRAAYGYSGANIIREEEKRAFFREIITRYSFDFEDEKDFVSDLMAEISRVKGEMMDLTHYYAVSCPEEIFREIYTAYQEMLLSKRLLDFDDMQSYTYQLFAEREDILARWQKRFAYLLIDEFQDISPVQYAIVRMLAKPQDNLFIVGDDDQSIYRFRGARPELMLNFEKDYPKAGRVLLDINYRCSPAVVKGAGRVIEHNQKRFPKKILSGRQGGEPIFVKVFADTQAENRWIAERLKYYREQGAAWEEMAVLFRTNTQPRAMIEQLMYGHIPFWIKDALPNIYEHFIGRDLIGYIQMARGSRDRKWFLRLANRPKRYISREAFRESQGSFEALRLFYEDKRWMLERIDEWELDLKWLAKLTPYAAIQYIRKKIGYDDFIKDYAVYRRIREEDLLEVLNELTEAAKPFLEYDSWFEHIEAYGKELKEKAKQNQSERRGVVLSTMHSAKGLEYRAVFIPGANEGVTPHPKAVLEADIEEERRMFYVAMTRAKDWLHISYVKERNQKEMEPSRFVAELLGESMPQPGGKEQ